MDFHQYQTRIDELEEEIRLLKQEQQKVLATDRPDLLLTTASAVTRALMRHGPLTRKILKQSISSNHRPTAILTPALDYLEAEGIVEKEGAKYLVSTGWQNTRST